MGGHQSSRAESVTWFTPPAIIDALGGAESFDLDPCTHADRPWPTAQSHYTQEDDGLTLPWFGRVWLNPPYSTALIARFLVRMVEHNRGVALIFARTETRPFHRSVWQAATGLLFLHGRLHFHRADGSRAKRNGGAPSVLIAYGDEDRDILAAAPIDGAFVPLRLPRSVIVQAIVPSWREALEAVFAQAEGPISLAEIYRAFVGHPKTTANVHYREKIRQTLKRGAFERVERGLWRKRGGASA
jgi:hypothetical protein